MTDLPQKLPDLRLDPSNACIWRGDERIDLTPKSFALLAHLAANTGRLVTKDELLSTVWPQTFVGDAVLKVNIKLIRDLLGDDARNPWLIETVHRRGYRLLADLMPAAAPTAAPAHAATLPPLVGRGEALARLQAHWDVASSGQRQLAFVTGEPGIGKTAVVERFAAETAAMRTARIGRGYCLEDYGAGEAYLPILDALEDLLHGDDGPAVAAVLRRYAPTWVDRLPWLGAAPTAGEPTPADPGASRERMLREIATALEALCSERPLLLVLEDLHWSDPSTVVLLAYLAQRRQPAQLLIIGTFRPVDLILAAHPLKEIKQTLQTRQQCAEVALWYFSDQDVRVYLEARLDGPVDDSLVALVQRRTSGNPLFVLSVVDHLSAADLIHADDGMWQVTASAPADVVPDALHAAIERRLDHLDENERIVLEAGSIAGMEFSTAAAAAGIATSSLDVDAVCAKLVRRGEILRAKGAATLPGGAVSGRYEFRHALYQNVLYDGVSPARRMEMHRRVGSWAETSGAGPGELAYHFARCGSDAHARKAVAYAVGAAELARSVFAHDEATRHFEAALAIAQAMRDRDPQLETEMLVCSAEAQQRAGKIGAADRNFRNAAMAAQEIGDAALEARAAVGIGHGYQRIGSADTALIAHLESALGKFAPGDHPLKALAIAHLDYALSSLPNSLARRADLGQEALEMARRVGDVDIHGSVLQYTRWAFKGPQTVAEWRAGVREVESLLPHMADAEREMLLRHVLVTDLLDLGETERALRQLDALTHCAEEAQLPWCLWLVARSQTAIALLRGQLAEAERLIGETLAFGQRTDHPNVLQMFGAQSCLLALERGQLTDAMAIVAIGIEQNPSVPTWHAVASLLAAENGDMHAAAAELAAVGAGGFLRIPQDTTWLIATGFAANAAFLLDDAESGRSLYKILLPYRNRCTGLSSSILSLGHTERYVGLAAAAAGFDSASEHLRRALDENERIGARPWAVLTRRDLARVLERRRESSGDVRELRRAARAEAKDLGMTGWLDRF